MRQPSCPQVVSLLIRSSMCGYPDPFRTVRNLGCVPACCSCSSGFPECCPPRWLPAWLPRMRVHASGGGRPHLSNLCTLLAWTRSLVSPVAEIIPCIFRIMNTSAATARTVQGMARVRSGQAPAWPLSTDWSVRRGSGVKRDFACTVTRHFSPALVVLRSQSRLRLEGRTRTLSGPSPDLSPRSRLVHLPFASEDLLIRRSGHIVQDRRLRVCVPRLFYCPHNYIYEPKSRQYCSNSHTKPQENILIAKLSE